MGQVAAASRLKDDERGPKYLDIRGRLLKQLESGVYELNEPLPRERDLAVSLDVAVGTVRRALQGLEEEGLIRRIRGKGTFVNSSKERREHTKTDVLSVILPRLSGGLFPALIEGLYRAVGDTQYQLMLSSSENNVHRQEALLRQALEQKVAGIVIVTPTTSSTQPEHIRKLQKHHIPVVLCHRGVKGVAAPLVGWSGEQVGQMAAETLLSQGHRRIVNLVSIREELSMAASEAMRQTIREHGIEESYFGIHCHGTLSRELNPLRSALSEVLEQLLRDKSRPTGIMCFNTLDAEHVCLIAQKLGFNIPQDLSVLCFGDIRREGLLSQLLTTVAVDERDLGFQAGKLLSGMCLGQVPGESEHGIEIPLTVSPGETVGPAPKI